MLAPIAIFAFNRPTELANMLESLKQNPLFEESEKYVFIDGPRNEKDASLIKEVAQIAHTATDNVKLSPQNKGLGSSIIAGVSEVLNEHDSVIVLEDDLRLMPGFLAYMNNALEHFKVDERILAICGYSLKIKTPKDYDSTAYLGDRASSWGWGTWRDRWEKVDWGVSDWTEFSNNKKATARFNQCGSDMFGMLRDYMEGRNRSWAIRFCYHQFKNGLYSVHPVKSLVDNEGFGEAATNCRQKYNRFKIELTDSINLKAEDALEPNKTILRQLHRYHSIPIRIYSRIRKLLNV